MIGNAVPDGFEELRLTGGYFRATPPFYGRLHDGVPVTGFRVQEPHVNPIGICHGGIIASLADMQSIGALQLADVHDRFALTINLTVDYLRPAKLGAWVEMRAELLRMTPGLLFTQALIRADDALIARSSGIYKLSNAPHTRRDPALMYR